MRLNSHSSRIHALSDKIERGSTMETTAVHTTLVKSLGISVATVALALMAYGASAQEKKAAPAKKPPACKTIKQQAGCEGRAADCTWVGESKDAKGKVKAKAYCRAKPKETAKKK
jgi:hypothetical protein